jgi:hypothetical protein
MSRLGLLIIPVTLLAAFIVRAQETDESFRLPTASTRSTLSAPTLSPGEIQATPEMWFYEQERLFYADPKNAVRANAEFRAYQRARRLAALRWYGFSNSRPLANPDPIHGIYSPRWVGNGYIPSHWIGGGGSTVIIAHEPARRYQ